MRKVVRKATGRVRKEGLSKSRQVQEKEKEGLSKSTGRYNRMRKVVRKTAGRERGRKAEQVDRQVQENEKGYKEDDGLG